jgi:choline dehydrogenase
MPKSPVFDVVIVGAGPAGCVLASRLSADPARSVALIEAGPDYGPEPSAWPLDLRESSELPLTSHPWGYVNRQVEGAALIDLPRAKVVGGSSTVNGCMWLRGSAADYDGWEALGNPGWSFRDLLPYFRKAESDPIGGEFHGSDGPVPVLRVTDTDLTEVERALVASARELGMPYIADHNGAGVQRPGVGPNPRNVRDGVRMNASYTYLASARARANLVIFPDTTIDRVEHSASRATGVRTADGQVIHAERVVLAAGAYGTPAILMRSGVGPADHLTALGIQVVADLPGVGSHLLDHPRTDGLMMARIREEFWPDATTFCPILIKGRSRNSAVEIDYHIYEGQSFDAALGAWMLWLSVSLANAASRGTVRLTSADPAATLDIDHCHLTEPADLEAFCDGIEFAHNLIETYPLAAMATPLPEYGRPWTNRDELRAWARAHCSTTFHPSSTCRMGPSADPLAVVDEGARVHGMDGLGVADASIFPTGPSANIHATVVAVAEKVADLMMTSS